MQRLLPIMQQELLKCIRNSLNLPEALAANIFKPGN